MTALLVLFGALCTVFGATAGAALVASSRRALATAVARRLRGEPESLAWLALVDRDLAAAAATTTAGVIVIGAAFPAAFAGATVFRLVGMALILTIPVAVVSGYLLPRWLSAPRAERFLIYARPILQPWARLLAGVLPARRFARPTDVRALIHEGAAAGFTPDHELTLAGAVIGFAQRPVREIMTPRTEVVAVSEGASLADVTRTIMESGYSRIPVYRESLDEIVGMLHAFDLFRIQPGDPLPIRPVTFTPATRPCGDVLVDLQRERRHLAVVLDEFGGTLGIATLEDLLEAMVGEIYDEHDVPPAASPARIPPGPILELDGSAPVAALEEAFGVALPAGSAVSVGGRLTEVIGRIPQAGECFTFSHLELSILRATPNRIDQVVVRRDRPAPVSLAPGEAGTSTPGGARP